MSGSGAPRLILASGSATRHALMRAAGLAFEARPAAMDEAALKASARAEGLSPDEAALLLAGMKARRIRKPGAVVIGADQLLVCEGEWLDKPPDREAARVQLLRLRGRTHVLHTAVTCLRDGAEIWRHVARPRLTMRAFSDAFLDAYLAAEADHVTASVGGYRLEGPGIQLFDRVEGEHGAILGLPMLPLLGFLRRHRAILS